MDMFAHITLDRINSLSKFLHVNDVTIVDFVSFVINYYNNCSCASRKRIFL